MKNIHHLKDFYHFGENRICESLNSACAYTNATSCENWELSKES